MAHWVKVLAAKAKTLVEREPDFLILWYIVTQGTVPHTRWERIDLLSISWLLVCAVASVYLPTLHSVFRNKLQS